MLFALLVFLASAFAVDVVIGMGTTYNTYYDYPAVYGGYYMNAREQYLITAAEFAANGGGAGNITTLGFNVYGVNGCGTLPNFTIRMGQTTLSALSTTFETGLTQVYTNAAYQPVVGWNNHVLDTPFAWDGSSNVVVEVSFDMQTAYSENTSTYYSSTSPNYMALYYRSDTTAWNTVATGTQSYNRPNMKFDMPAGGAVAPFPAVLVSPSNGATYVGPDATLNWGSGGGAPDGYDIYFGTTNPPPFLADLGNITTYDPVLDYNTPYYWKVVPYNSIGDATGCPVWSFTTAPEGTVAIGDGSDISPMLPINAFYGYTYSQSIYPAAAIGSPGIISSVGYYWNGAAEGLVSNDWTIYMGHTTNPAFSSATDWLPLASLTQVFTGTVTLPATPGWVNIPLTTPFVYNGSSNLVIGVDENAAGYDYPYGQFYCTSTTGVSSLLYNSDGTNPDPASPPTAGYLRTSIPNTLITIGDIPVAPPGIPTLVSPVNGATGVALNGWNLSWNMNPVGGLPNYYEVYLKQGDDVNITSEYDYYFDSIASTSFNPAANGAVFGYNETWYWTVQAVNDEGVAIVDPPWRFDTTPPPPEILVNPMSLTQSLEHGTTGTQQLTITNNGGLPLNYTIGFTDTTPRSSGIISPEAMRALTVNPGAALLSENAPFVGPSIESESRAIFDLQFYFAPDGTAGANYGLATDGNFFYSTNWRSVAPDQMIHKYNLDGTYVGNFIVTGCGAVRNLAYDGQYFYATNASTTIYKLDFTTNTVVGTITSPVAARGIAYDSDHDAFWVGNGWNADLRLIDRSGNQLQALVPAIASMAGIAYDNVSGPTPTLWANTQTGSIDNTIAQIDLTTGAVLQSIDVTATLIPILSGTAGAGGLAIGQNIVYGTASLLAMCQNEAIYGLELCDLATWVTADPRTGTVAAGGSAVVDIDFDATSIDPGVYTGTFSISNNAGPNVEVPVQLTITGDWPAVFSIDPVSYNFGDVEQLNPMEVQFTITNTGGSTPNPLVIADGGIVIADDVEGNFFLNTPGLPVTLDHNETYSFMVTFIPQTQGAKTANLVITDNLVTRNVSTIPLSGNGVPEHIDFVVNLAGELQGTDTVNLTWALYNGIPGEPGWLHYDDGTNVNGIGTGGAATFDVAAKFDSGTMYGYSGMEITKINYFPRSANTTYTLKVWTGWDGSMAPTTLVYTQAHVPTVLAWNEVLLNTPIPIAGNEAVWVGYECNVAVVDAATDDYFPAGCDAGPAAVGYGDLISLGTWESMATSYSLNYNWNIQAYLDDPVIRGKAPQLLSIPVINAPALNHNYSLATASGNNEVRALRGFNVFRDTVQLNVALVQDFAYTDLAVPIGPHSYTVQAVYYSSNSLMSDPFMIDILPPVPVALPFVENWATSDFITNQWDTSATNWAINATVGLAAPCAQFGWSPQITNYAEYLTSYYFDGTGFTGLKLKFDLALNNFSTDAENLFTPEIWNSSTGVWTALDTFSSFENSGDGWDFDTFVYDISTWAVGETFRIRFKAHGEDSYEINNWYLDNIVIEAIPTTLAAPASTVAWDGTQVNLDWTPVAGADWYLLYSGLDPYGTYTYVGYLPVTWGNSTTFAPVDKEFYQVKACSMELPVVRGTRLANRPWPFSSEKK